MQLHVVIGAPTATVLHHETDEHDDSYYSDDEEPRLTNGIMLFLRSCAYICTFSVLTLSLFIKALLIGAS